ncbi:MAG: GcrA family cell cycle regulator [Alphaproteobacteria bacterium]|jgi:GcrA cell cycle regulator|nr:GcrA family cell cycle regulator [Alphaproteobacteria bacterium]
MKDSVWDDSLVDRLKDLYLNKSMTAVNIGNELGFSKNAIIGKIHRLQLNALKEGTAKDQGVSQAAASPALQMDTLFTIDTDNSNIKNVINIAKKSNTVIKNEPTIAVAHHSSSNLQPTTELEHNRINHEVFQLQSKNSKLGKYKLADIEFNMCVWPYGEDNFTFCGAKTSAGKSYCEGHLDLVYFVTKKFPKKKYATLEEEAEIEEVEDFEEEEVEI